MTSTTSNPRGESAAATEPQSGGEPSCVEFIADDGAVLRGERFGPVEAPLVVLLHGGGQTRHAWASTAEILVRKGFSALTLDQRGHGESDWSPRGDYRIDDYVTDLQRVVAELPALARKPILVGASLGGLVGLLTAGEAPEPLFRGIVLVDIAVNLRPEGVKRVLDFMAAHPEGFATLDDAAEAVAAYLPHRERRPSPAGLEKNLRLGEDGRWRWHYDPRFVAGSFVEHMKTSRDRFLRAAAHLRCPTLLIHGQKSDVVGEDEVEHFLETAPGARAIRVDGAHHMVAGDENDAFAAAVLAFLCEL